MRNHSYTAIPAAIVFGALLILWFALVLTLGGAIMMQNFAKDHTVELGVMHGRILTFSTVFCLVATAFAALLSKEHQPHRD
jgi:hypothetical protein